MKRGGGLIGGSVVLPENPARWTSKYGSIVTSLYGVAQADGLNEKGLGADLLFLRATDFGTRQAEKPAFHAAL
jgi:choloylglycine hydrolase